ALPAELPLYQITLTGPVVDYQPLAQFQSLGSLRVIGEGFSDVSLLSGLSDKLYYLAFESTQVTDFSTLANFTQLNQLQITRHDGLDNANSLAGLSPVQHLELSDNAGLVDISALSNLTNLYYLGLNYTQVNDLTPLFGLTALQSLNIEYIPLADTSQVDTLRANGVEVWGQPQL
ncbi:hypothetical protein L2680_09480, partial [Shewanella gelidii]|nr:hypothetical protein [Shewanella gelidii]